MPKYLIEVHHEAGAQICADIVQIFLSSGSHFLTHADWGCMDGVHTAWIVVEVDSKEQAECILPPAIRSQARIVALNKFTKEQVESGFFKPKASN